MEYARAATAPGSDMISIDMISIGDELLEGRTLDSNGATLGRWLAGRGLVLRRRVTLPDDRGAITAALREALADAALVVVSGGLGPTADDVTREAAADLLGVGCVVDEAAAAAIRAYRAGLGRPPNEGERRMASLPAGARPIPNPAGVALAFALDWTPAAGGPAHAAVFLPGVPREFEALLDPAVGPLLAARAGWAAGAVGAGARRTLTYSVFGVPESELDERLRPLEVPGAVRFQYGVRTPVVRVTLVAEGAAAGDEAWAAHTARFRAALGDAAYGEGDVPLAEVVVGHLRRLGWRLATAESCTGGLVAHWLTQVAGASAVFDRGLVTYANEAKEALLGVPGAVLAQFGAVSRETVEHMARGARERAGAELGVAISGIAGPTGGTPDKPVGTVHLALAAPDGLRWEQRRFAGGRSDIKRQAAGAALDLVRRYCEAR